MYVVDIIPFSRTAPAGTLSYRSRSPLAEGTLVSVSLRKRMVQGLVVGCQSVTEAKAQLKTASFMLTKTVPQVAGTLPEPLRIAAERIASYHAATLGSTLSGLFSELIRSDVSLAGVMLEPSSDFSIGRIERPLKDRAGSYRAHIEARAGVTLLVVPTIAETEYWKQEFADLSPTVLSGSIAGKRREQATQSAADAKKLVITTPSFSWTPIHRLESIIIERMGAGGYRAPKRPYLDFRIALTERARAQAIPLVYGDFPLPLEYRDDTAPLIATGAAVSLLDLRREKPDEKTQTELEPWSAVPRSMREPIRLALAEGGRVLVLAVRKGYAPSVVCRDCGTSRTDELGNVLTFTKEGPHGRAFRSVDGRITESTNVLCAHCGSWNLLPLGVGVERVEEELRTAFPDARIIRFDGDMVRTSASARKALMHASEPGTIIVGTEGALPWLHALHAHSFALAVIASADSLLALPFWRSRERFVRLGLLLAQMADHLLLGTRLPEDTAVDAVVHPNATAFFTEESALRAALRYPPFGTLIALQAEGTRSQLDMLDTSIRTAIAEYPFTVLPDRALTRTQFRRSYVLHLEKDIWPDPELSQRLKHLSPAIRVLIDPEAF